MFTTLVAVLTWIGKSIIGKIDIIVKTSGKKKKVVKARDDFDSRLPGAAHDSEEEGEGGGGEGKQ